MTEEEAQTWLCENLSVSRETLERLDAFRRMVIEENARQNLISGATIDQFWARHIVDSAQLLVFDFPVAGDAQWLDLGTGAGFPGMVIAILRNAPITLVESRRKRIDFLKGSAARMDLRNVDVKGCRLEALNPAPFSVISARAFAPLPRLLHLAHSFSTAGTLWLLPKGRRAGEELAEAEKGWTGMFHVKQSLTDPESSIIVATQVARKRAK